MKIRYYSHASFQIIGSSNTRILCDPWLYNPICHTLWQFPECPIPIDEYTQQDILSISHDHADHFCPKTLSHFKRSTPILIRKYGDENNPIKPILLDLGFQQIIELENRETVRFKEFSLTQFWDILTSDSSLLISDQEFTIFHQNDCMLSYEEATYIGNHFKVNAALLFTSSASIYPTFFKMDKDVKHQETIKRNEKVMERAVKYAQCLNVPYVIPCAGDMIRFRSPETDIFAGALPVEFKQFVLERGYSFQVLTPNPGETVDIKNLNAEFSPKYASREEWINHLNRFRERQDVKEISAQLEFWEKQFQFEREYFIQMMTDFCVHVESQFHDVFRDKEISRSRITVCLSIEDQAEALSYLFDLDFENKTCQIHRINLAMASSEKVHMTLYVKSNYLSMVSRGILNFDDLRGGLLVIERSGEFTKEEAAFWHFLSCFNSFYIKIKAQDKSSEFLGKFDKLVALNLGSLSL